MLSWECFIQKPKMRIYKDFSIKVAAWTLVGENRVKAAEMLVEFLSVLML